ncbi:hypothetical protein [Nonomuraea sp. NPDC046570]
MRYLAFEEDLVQAVILGLIVAGALALPSPAPGGTERGEGADRPS